jgi:REP element-mobilizing transposase RayT
VEPAAGYFITFTTYGERLHGDERGSVRRGRLLPSERLEPNADLVAFERGEMGEPPLRLEDAQRSCVAATISEVCAFKGWALHALNVRTNHVHIVVSAGDIPPEAVMNACKAWATRRLRERGLLSPQGKVWTRHGSTRYLKHPEDVDRASGYVIEGQGEDIGGVRWGEGEVP